VYAQVFLDEDPEIVGGGDRDERRYDRENTHQD
jgi:hypothetical protein